MAVIMVSGLILTLLQGSYWMIDDSLDVDEPKTTRKRSKREVSDWGGDGSWLHWFLAALPC